MDIRETTDKEVIETLNKLKSYFDSPLFENNRSVINALEFAVEAIENKEDSEKLNENPFDRVNNNERYCFIDSNDEIHQECESNDSFDDELYERSNYFNNKDFAKQVMLHQLLYRRLLKFKLERESQKTKISNMSYFVNLDKTNILYVEEVFTANRGCNGVHFNEPSTAELALNKVVKPFLKEYPDFIWNL